MLSSVKARIGSGLAIALLWGGLAIALLWGIASTGAAIAQTSGSTPAATPTPAAKPAAAGTSTEGGRPYFIEFRSRNAATYGHAFVLYGANGSKGKIAGFHPAGDRRDCVNCSALPWMLGHLIPVPAETGPSDGDDEPKLYLTARYRVQLTTAEYKKVESYIKYKQANAGTWHAVLNNCIGFIGDIANYMGLQTPSPMGMGETKMYVNELAKLNGGTPSKIAGLPAGLVRNAPDSLRAKSGGTASAGNTNAAAN